MVLKTKMYIDDTYCRPTLAYGWEFLTLNEKIKQELKRSEGAVIKRILNIIKTTSNTLIFNAMAIREPQDQLFVVKIKLFNRLKENEFTNKLIENLKRFNTNNNKLGNNSLLMQIETILHKFELEELNKDTTAKIINQISSKEKQMRSDGLIDSINYCIINRSENPEHNKILHLLLMPHMNVTTTTNHDR